jgi:hypothetical protein
VGSIPITRFRKFLLHFHEMYVIMLLQKSSYFVSLFMREWLSGGVQPCQGWGRGFDPRLALFLFGGRSPAVLQESGLFVLQVSRL